MENKMANNVIEMAAELIEAERKLNSVRACIMSFELLAGGLEGLADLDLRDKMDPVRDILQSVSSDLRKAIGEPK